MFDPPKTGRNAVKAINFVAFSNLTFLFFTVIIKHLSSRNVRLAVPLPITAEQEEREMDNVIHNVVPGSSLGADTEASRNK